MRSHPDRAKTPGCHALYAASSRCADRIFSTSASDNVDRSRMPRLAATTDAVVQAMPFWTKGRLYGAASPVITSRSVPRTVAASSRPVSS
jgi:hypothetical protein